MKILKHKTSKLIPLVIACMIPFAMLIAIGYNVYLNNFIADSALTIEQLKLIMDAKLSLPLAELITFGTVVIPAIMIRKAVREGTHNTFVRTGREGAEEAMLEEEVTVIEEE
jgi:hypothetical protein